MYKPPHLAYLSKPIDWYLSEHRIRQSSIGNSRCGPVAYTLDQLLKRNKNREYKGVHPFCGAEELDPPEILTCVIFKRILPDKPTEYFHTLYLGPETMHPELVHNTLLEKLGMTPEQYQASLISRFR